MGGDSKVCVCSAQLNCDGEHSLEHLNHFSKENGHVTTFSSSKSGARFEQHDHKFASSANGHYNLELEIDRSRKHQKIVGFGGKFREW